MTPAVALERAIADDERDGDEVIDQFARRLAVRQFYARDRIASRAALDLCAARDHDRRLRGCVTCRVDISRAMRDGRDGAV